MSATAPTAPALADEGEIERLGWLFEKILGRQQRQGITDPREIAAAIIALWHVVVSDHDELVALRQRVAKLERVELDGPG